MSRKALAQWKLAALQLTRVRSSLVAPVHVLTTEATELVRFCKDYWEPVSSSDGARPGLSQAEPSLPSGIAEELLELQYALHAAHTEYLLTIPLMHGGLRKRAESVLHELVAAIESALDDGTLDEFDRQIAALRQSHLERSSAVDALCAQLSDYATLASQMRPRLAALSRFNMPLIDDAHHLARELRDLELEADRAGPTAATLDLRNRIASLLMTRMELVRTAAASTFQGHPHIVHESESSFDRRTRALQRLPHSDIAELAGRTARIAGH